MEKEKIDKMISEITDMLTEVGYDAKWADDELKKHSEQTIDSIYKILT